MTAAYRCRKSKAQLLHVDTLRSLLPFAERRSVRSRKISQRIGTVSAAERENVTSARLEALENDDGAGEGVVGDSDDEFLLEESDEGWRPSRDPFACTRKILVLDMKGKE